jgi:hypothetical protein
MGQFRQSSTYTGSRRGRRQPAVRLLVFHLHHIPSDKIFLNLTDLSLFIQCRRCHRLKTKCVKGETLGESCVSCTLFDNQCSLMPPVTSELGSKIELSKYVARLNPVSITPASVLQHYPISYLAGESSTIALDQHYGFSKSYASVCTNPDSDVLSSGGDVQTLPMEIHTNTGKGTSCHGVLGFDVVRDSHIQTLGNRRALSRASSINYPVTQSRGNGIQNASSDGAFMPRACNNLSVSYARSKDVDCNINNMAISISTDFHLQRPLLYTEQLQAPMPKLSDLTVPGSTSHDTASMAHTDVCG